MATRGTHGLGTPPCWPVVPTESFGNGSSGVGPWVLSNAVLGPVDPARAWVPGIGPGSFGPWSIWSWSLRAWIPRSVALWAWVLGLWVPGPGPFNHESLVSRVYVVGPILVGPWPPLGRWVLGSLVLGPRVPARSVRDPGAQTSWAPQSWAQGLGPRRRSPQPPPATPG